MKKKVKTVGSIGDMACFSFYPGKNLVHMEMLGQLLLIIKYLKDLLKLRNLGGIQKYHIVLLVSIAD